MKSGFWNWLFGDDDNSRKKYSYAGTKSNILTVYTDYAAQAEKARDIMNKQGALDVNDVTKDRYARANNSSEDNLSEEERARIINKAKNSLYLTSDTRNYSFRSRGMTNEMDSLGSQDTF